MELAAGEEKSSLGIVGFGAKESHDAALEVDKGVDLAPYLHRERQQVRFVEHGWMSMEDAQIEQLVRLRGVSHTQPSDMLINEPD